MPQLTAQQLHELKSFDTPTVCNAIETFNVRGLVEGFMGMDIRCLYPELGTMLGYAVTLEMDATTPDVKQDPAVWEQWVRAMDAAPKPIVLVMQDVGPQTRKSAHVGDVMATLARRLGVVGLVTDGGVRDINEVRALNFHYFAAGVVPSHGNHRLVSVNKPVTIDGVLIQPGDLLHGDVNGVTTIPLAIADKVAAAAQSVRDREAELLTYLKSPEFTVDGFIQRRAKH